VAAARRRRTRQRHHRRRSCLSRRRLSTYHDPHARTRRRAQPAGTKSQTHPRSPFCVSCVVGSRSRLSCCSCCLLGDGWAYEWAYRLVSRACLSSQFVAVSNRAICSIFPQGAAAFSLFSRTFNPKVGGSNPPRARTHSRAARARTTTSSAVCFQAVSQASARAAWSRRALVERYALSLEDER
jgi:hypothetical protein